MTAKMFLQKRTSSDTVNHSDTSSKRRKPNSSRWVTTFDPVTGPVDLEMYLNDQIDIEATGNDANMQENASKTLQDQVVMNGANVFGIVIGATSSDYASLRPGVQISSPMVDTILSRFWFENCKQDKLSWMPVRLMMEVSKYSGLSVENRQKLGIPLLSAGCWPRLLGSENLFKGAIQQRYLAGLDSENGHFIAILVSHNDLANRLEATILDPLGFDEPRTIENCSPRLKNIVIFMLDFLRAMGSLQGRTFSERSDVQFASVPRQTGIQNCGAMVASFMTTVMDKIEDFPEARNLNCTEAWKTFFDFDVNTVRPKMLALTQRYIVQDVSPIYNLGQAVVDVRLLDLENRILEPEDLHAVLLSFGSLPFLKTLLDDTQSVSQKSESDHILNQSIPQDVSIDNSPLDRSDMPSSASSLSSNLCVLCGVLSKTDGALRVHMASTHPECVTSLPAADTNEEEKGERGEPQQKRLKLVAELLAGPALINESPDDHQHRARTALITQSVDLLVGRDHSTLELTAAVQQRSRYQTARGISYQVPRSQVIALECPVASGHFSLANACKKRSSTSKTYLDLNNHMVRMHPCLERNDHSFLPGFVVFSYQPDFLLSQFGLNQAILDNSENLPLSASSEELVQDPEVVFYSEPSDGCTLCSWFSQAKTLRSRKAGLKGHLRSLIHRNRVEQEQPQTAPLPAVPEDASANADGSLSPAGSPAVEPSTTTPVAAKIAVDVKSEPANEIWIDLDDDDDDAAGDSPQVLAQKSQRRAAEEVRAAQAQEVLARSYAHLRANLKIEFEAERVKEEEISSPNLEEEVPSDDLEEVKEDDNLHPDLEDLSSYDSLEEILATELD